MSLLAGLALFLVGLGIGLAVSRRSHGAWFRLPLANRLSVEELAEINELASILRKHAVIQTENGTMVCMTAYLPGQQKARLTAVKKIDKDLNVVEAPMYVFDVDFIGVASDLVRKGKDNNQKQDNNKQKQNQHQAPPLPQSDFGRRLTGQQQLGQSYPIRNNNR